MKTDEQAPPAPNPQKKPRKDRGTRRVSLPETIARDLDRRFPSLTVPEAIKAVVEERDKAVAIADEAVTLPPSVHARLAPAAAATGRSVSDLLADMEGVLCLLLDGKLFQAHPGGGDPVPFPSLHDRLTEDFRARLMAATAPSPEPPAAGAQIIDLAESLAKGRP